MMPWSDESIERAIQIAKAKDAIFVVYVEDDTKQTALHGFLEGSNITNLLRNEKFVAVRITSSSQTYRDFVDIYQLVPVPSIFFIGNNGWPLEIIGGELSEDEIMQRIRTLTASSRSAPIINNIPASERPTNIEVGTAATGENGTSSSIAKEAKESAKLPAQSTKEEAGEVSSSVQPNNEQLRSGSSETILQPACESPVALEISETVLLSTDEVSSSTIYAPATSTKNVNLEKSVNSLSRIVKDSEDCISSSTKGDEIFPAPSQIRNAKAQEAVIVEEPGNEEQQPAVVSPESLPQRGSSPEKCDEVHFSRIQFRLPDGSSHTHTFSTGTSIREVRQYVITSLSLPYREFSMSTGYPRFELTDPEETLAHLGMMPTAVILINTLAPVSSTPSFISMARDALWFLLVQPFSTVNVVFTYVYQRLFGTRDQNARDGAAPEQGSGRHSPQPRNPTQGNQPGARHRRTIQREGNVYRLSNRADDSDDENNTWNGNSTQQM